MRGSAGQVGERAGEGWIPAEPSPTSGAIKNDSLGFLVGFNSEAINARQAEFVSFDYFREKVCTVYDILWKAFEVERILTPTINVVLQKGYELEKLNEAEQYLRELNVCCIPEGLVALLGGTQSVLECTVVTEENVNWNGVPIQRRRRFHGAVVRQEKQIAFDNRLLQRVRLLSKHQQDAMAALLNLRRQQPDVLPVAVQIDLENSLESEFPSKAFDLPGFLQESWDWSENVRTSLPRLRRATSNA